MATSFVISFLVVVCWILLGRLNAEKQRSLMWENRAIRLTGEVNRETGRQYYFIDDKNGIEYIENDSVS